MKSIEIPQKKNAGDSYRVIGSTETKRALHTTCGGDLGGGDCGGGNYDDHDFGGDIYHDHNGGMVHLSLS